MPKYEEIRDFELACNTNYEINSLGLTENAVLPKNKNKENYKPSTLIDQTLELIDPTPNIYTLFLQFNTRFFWDVLSSVEVKWSNRMTSSAGVCSYRSRNRQCVISLSVPLLKFRPRKDLVETLLHEMIHGYLFLTNNNRNRDGHGPQFCEHMRRINREAGTNITIYHNFHDEVRLYQQYWWKCTGPCQNKAPYFGIVRRSVNRAPGPSDFWWQKHQQNCNGQFIKVKEPKNFKTKTAEKDKETKSILKTSDNRTMFDWLINNTGSKQRNILKSNSTPTDGSKSVVPKVSVQKTTNLSNNTDAHKNLSKKSKTLNKVNDKNTSKEIKKLGNGISNVYGWTSKSASSSFKDLPNIQKFSSIGKLGGSSTGKSNLLDKFYVIEGNIQSKLNMTNQLHNILDTKNTNSVTINKNIHQHGTTKDLNNRFVNCSMYNSTININTINKHMDSCLLNKNIVKKSYESSSSLLKKDTLCDNSMTLLPNESSQPTCSYKRKNVMNDLPNKQLKLDNSHNSELVNCPSCQKKVEVTNINDHLDVCLLENQKHISNSYEKNNATFIKNSSTLSSNSSSDHFIDNFNTITNSTFIDEKHDIIKQNKCLVCDTIISEMSLLDHLEECIGLIFKDESTFFSDYNDTNLIDLPVEENKYPYPVCMEILPEDDINEHRCVS